MRLEVKITTSTDPLTIRKGHSTSYAKVGSIPKGSLVIINDQVNVGSEIWQKLEDGRGWICHKTASGSTYTSTIRNLDTTKTVQSSPPTKPSSFFNTSGTASTTVANSTGSSTGLDAKIIEMLYAQNSTVNSSDKIDGSTRLFGSPFQFIKETDFRLNNKIDLGRKYLENIIAESPVVYFIPGKPSYLPDLTEQQREGFTQFFSSKKLDDENAKTALDAIIGNKDIRFFDFVSTYYEYTKYVNLLCRISAVFIGLGDKTAPGSDVPYKKYDWSDYKFKNDYEQKSSNKNSIFSMGDVADDLQESMFGRYRYIQFYADPNTSFSESSSNSTSNSKLEGFFDTAEGLMKELAFLTNSMAVKNVSEVQGSFAKGMGEISEKMLKNTKENFFSRLLDMSSYTLSGSNILFPELWGDAAYNKSYNVTVNLVSPYGDKESIYLNIIVPLMHILALAMPRQTSANSYASPFLIKAFSKGWFSCELGIIDSVNIDKGGGGDSWSVDGLPTEVRVQLGVKDLYSNLMISSASRPELFFQNQGLIDFLAVTCGIDVTKPNFAMKLEALFQLFLNKFTDIPSNTYNQFIEGIRNFTESIYKIY